MMHQKPWHSLKWQAAKMAERRAKQQCIQKYAHQACTSTTVGYNCCTGIFVSASWQ
jgi:hypothetical protein